MADDVTIQVGANVDPAVDGFEKIPEAGDQMAGKVEQQFARLSASINKGSDTKVAQASIRALDDMLKSGAINADTYGAAINQVQLSSGMASEKSQDAADQLLRLNNQLAKGEIDATKYAEGVSQIEKEMKSAEPKTIDMGKAIVVLNQGLELGQKLIGSMKQVFDFAKEGAEVARLEDAFKNLGKSEADLDKLRKASLGTINDVNLMLGANKADLLGVAKNTDDLASLLQVAAVRAKAMGVSTTQAFNDIVTGIGRMSPLILDNLGIVTGGQATFDKYAASIGKTADKLTDAEKKQALLNKVIAEGAALGPLIEDQATKFERMQATLDNVGNSAKKALAEILAPAVENLNTSVDVLVNGQEKINEAFAATAEQILVQQTSYEGYISALDGTAQAASATRSQIEQNGQTIEVYNGSVQRMTEAQWQAARAEQEATAAANQYLADRNAYFAEQVVKTQEANAANSELQDGLRALAEANQAGSESEAVLKQMTEETTRALEEQRQKAADAAIELSSLAESIGKATLADQAKISIEALGEALKAGDIDTETYKQKVTDLQLAFGLATPASLAQADALTQLNQLFVDGKITSAEMEGAIQKLKQASADGTVTGKELNLVYEDGSSVFKDVASSAHSAAAEINAIPNHKTITIEYKTIGSPDGGGGGGSGSQPPGKAVGADFIVPPNPAGIAGDYYPVRAMPGERVMVTTPGDLIGGGSGPLIGQLTINAAPGMDVEALAQAVSQQIARELRGARR